MRSDAKASSAGSTLQAAALGRIFTGVAVTHGALGDRSRARRSTRFAVGLFIAALAVLALAPNASAFFTRAKIASFGSDGTSASFFDRGQPLAYEQAADTLYVRDGEGPKIYGFDAPAITPLGGAFPISVPSISTEGAELGIDNTSLPSAGNVYYFGQSSQNIFGYTPAGAPLGGNFPIACACNGDGFAVDSAGALLVGGASGGVESLKKFDSAGNPLATIDISAVGASAPSTIALDSNDDLYYSAFTAGQGAVFKLTAASGYHPASATKLSWAPASGGTTNAEALAVDSASHTLYVVEGNRISAYAADGTHLYDFAQGIANANFAGVAVDEESDKVYVADWAAGNDQVYVYEPAQNYSDATAVATPATSVTDTSAVIAAKITDNNALATAWRLELSSDGGSNWKSISNGQTTGNQTNFVVTGTATDLQPNADYQFRIVTNKGVSAGTAVLSAPLFFHTVAPPPVVTDVGAVEIADTSARLVGTIDPRNSDAGYVFEYGTTPALGSSTVAVGIGSGTTPTTISQLITGLTPGTTYYFKLIATNLVGATSSPSKTLTTRTDPLPSPSDRRWEMVTPPDKNYTDADSTAVVASNEAGVSPDGNSVGFCTTGLFGDPPGRMTQLCAPYMARRSTLGWETTVPFPDYCYTDPVSGISGGKMTVVLSRDFTRFVVEKSESTGCPIPPLDPSAPLAEGGIMRNLYFEDPSSNPFSYTLLAPQLGDDNGSATEFAGGSDDFSHVIYGSDANQTPDSPEPGDFRKLYDWRQQGEDGCVQAGGCLSLLSKDPSNVPFTTKSAVPVLNNLFGLTVLLHSAVSDDGDRVYFSNPTPLATDNCREAGCQIYMREGNVTTYDVSASECTTACGSPQTKADYFISATPAGDVAFFTSCAKLTDASAVEGCNEASPWLSDAGAPGAKLYRWDRGAPPGSRLTDLTLDQEPGDGVQPNFERLIGHSDNGETAFLVAASQLVSGQSTTAGEKLYRWRWNGGSPTVDYLGPYESLNGTNYSDTNSMQQHRHVTPDGEYLLIYTKLAYDAAGDRDSEADAYRWSKADGWICASCQTPGTPSMGGVALEEVSLRFNESQFPTLSRIEPRFFMSDDGQRIFFATPDALVPEDVNGEAGCPISEVFGSQSDNEIGNLYTCNDVYEWHDGTLSLVSSGLSGGISRLISSTPSGSDVFFYTAQRLVGWDVDKNVDIYDARVGGGFPEPPAQPPSCEGESCRGASTVAPAPASAGSAAFQGPGNPAPKHKAARKKGKKRQAKKQRGAQRRAAKHNRRVAR